MFEGAIVLEFWKRRADKGEVAREARGKKVGSIGAGAAYGHDGMRWGGQVWLALRVVVARRCKDISSVLTGREGW